MWLVLLAFLGFPGERSKYLRLQKFMELKIYSLFVMVPIFQAKSAHCSYGYDEAFFSDITSNFFHRWLHRLVSPVFLAFLVQCFLLFLLFWGQFCLFKHRGHPVFINRHLLIQSLPLLESVWAPPPCPLGASAPQPVFPWVEFSESSLGWVDLLFGGSLSWISLVCVTFFSFLLWYRVDGILIRCQIFPW